MQVVNRHRLPPGKVTRQRSQRAERGTPRWGISGGWNASTQGIAAGHHQLTIEMKMIFGEAVAQALTGVSPGFLQQHQIGIGGLDLGGDSVEPHVARGDVEAEDPNARGPRWAEDGSDRRSPKSGNTSNTAATTWVSSQRRGPSHNSASVMNGKGTMNTLRGRYMSTVVPHQRSPTHRIARTISNNDSGYPSARTRRNQPRNPIGFPTTVGDIDKKPKRGEADRRFSRWVTRKVQTSRFQSWRARDDVAPGG